MEKLASGTVPYRLPFQTRGLDDESKVRRGHARNVIKTLDEILRASLFLGEVRDGDEVFSPQVFGERMPRVVLPGQLRKLLAFQLEQFPKLFARCRIAPGVGLRRDRVGH